MYTLRYSSPTQAGKPSATYRSECPPKIFFRPPLFPLTRQNSKIIVYYGLQSLLRALNFRDFLREFSQKTLKTY